jgi:hypothetical protein
MGVFDLILGANQSSRAEEVDDDDEDDVRF